MIIKRLKLDHTTKRYMHKPESVQQNETYKILWKFWDTDGSPSLTQKTKLIWVNQKKKKTDKKDKKEKIICHLVDSAVEWN